jgi:chitodextrinase
VTAKATDIPVCAGSWDANTVYRKPDRVTYQGKVYEAKWWTLNEKPGSSQVWLLIGNDLNCQQ